MFFSIKNIGVIEVFFAAFLVFLPCIALHNVRIARFRQCRDSVRKGGVFIEYEATVTSTVCSVERRVS